MPKSLHNPNRIEFSLNHSLMGNWYWTVFLPTQINKVKTRQEAERNLANIIRKLQAGKFIIADIDYNIGKNIDYIGGVDHLLDKYAPSNDDGTKPAKVVSKRPKRKGKTKSRRVAKRVSGKKLRSVRAGTKKSVQGKPKRRDVSRKRRNLRVRSKRK